MLIDLSVVLNKETPVYEGDPQITIKPGGILEKDGYADSVLTFGNHNGTHIDAPSHMLENGKTLDRFPLETFVGKGVLVNVTNGITMDIVKNAPIKANDIVLFYTGMGEKYMSKEYYSDYPALSEEIGNYSVNKKVKMVGVDMCSVDHEPFPVHKIFFRNDILIIENLTNLNALDGKNFVVYALPLKFQIDGSPARVIAITED